VAFVALIAMVDSLFILVDEWIRVDPWGATITPEVFLKERTTKLSLSFNLSWLFTPIACFLGIPWQDLNIAGSLIGKKIVFNEFIAYLDMAKIGHELQPRTAIILSYALCGFANFSSIAIQIGGIGSLIPERKSELARFGVRAV